MAPISAESKVCWRCVSLEAVTDMAGLRLSEPRITGVDRGESTSSTPMNLSGIVMPQLCSPLERIASNRIEQWNGAAHYFDLASGLGRALWHQTTTTPRNPTARCVAYRIKALLQGKTSTITASTATSRRTSTPSGIEAAFSLATTDASAQACARS